MLLPEGILRVRSGAPSEVILALLAEHRAGILFRAAHHRPPSLGFRLRQFLEGPLGHCPCSSVREDNNRKLFPIRQENFSDNMKKAPTIAGPLRKLRWIKGLLLGL